MTLKPPDDLTLPLSSFVDVIREAPVNVDYPEYDGDIQAAVDYAASGTGGGEVFIPAATRTLTSAVTIPNFVELRGEGQGSILRCAGNHFALSLAPGNRSAIRNLHLDSAITQSSGGGINFASAGSNVRISDLYLGSGLYYGLDISPTSSSTAHSIRTVRWNGITGCNTAIRIGAGGALVTDVYFDHLVGTASTTSDMAVWVSMPVNSDTIKFSDSLFIKGALGIQAGTTGQVTNLSFHGVSVDTITGKGVNIANARSCQWIGGEISTCGSASDAGFQIGGSAKHTTLVGVTVQNCNGDGIAISNGALYSSISGGCKIFDNNQTNTASRFGIGVAANTTYFHIIGNFLGNNAGNGVTGHQKRPIDVATGSSDHYVISGNIAKSHDTADTVNDGGTGLNKSVTGNVA